MAARMPSLDQMLEARPEEYLPNHQYQYQTNQFATLSNGAQGGVALPQGDGSMLMLLDAITAQQTWSDASRPQADASTLYIEHGGKLGCSGVKFQRLQKLMNDEPCHRSFHFENLSSPSSYCFRHP
jgi:hypothetical protein